MSGLFTELFNFLKWSKNDVDNVPFKLYSRVTVGIFLVASVVSVAKDNVGEPINCKGADDDFGESYCWTHGAYHIENPRIAAEFGGSCFRKDSQKDDDARDTAYYLWVSLMLLIHGATFMIPNVLWKYLEVGWIKKLKLTEDREENDTKEHAITTAILLKSKSRKWTRKYFFTFMIFEYFNLAIAIATFFVIDSFLSGRFNTYGSDAVQYWADSDNRHRIDPMCNVFPTVVNCTYSPGSGVNGIPDKRSILCLLTPNLMNQKIYLVLWFWLLLLFVTSFLMTVYRIVTFSSKEARHWIMKRNVNTTKSEKVDNLDLSLENIGEWFIMGQICRNTSIEYAREFLTKMNSTVITNEDNPTQNNQNNDHVENNTPGIELNATTENNEGANNVTV